MQKALLLLERSAPLGNNGQHEIVKNNTQQSLFVVSHVYFTVTLYIKWHCKLKMVCLFLNTLVVTNPMMCTTKLIIIMLVTNTPQVMGKQRDSTNMVFMVGWNLTFRRRNYFLNFSTLCI